ncbi:MAG: hypothetical protein JXR05_09020 [Flavobacteriaceae bacterium]
MKNKITLISFLLLSTTIIAQFTQGQNFCDENKDGSYFPLVIEDKKIFWSNTHYIEAIAGRKTINKKTYIAFNQTWKEGNVDRLYLREENGVVYQYEECCGRKETVRYDKRFKDGHVWKTADKKGTYRILTTKGTFKTPLCNYKNVMIIEADLQGGKFKFYYLKGHGYIGASVNDQLVSYVTPRLD